MNEIFKLTYVAMISSSLVLNDIKSFKAAKAIRYNAENVPGFEWMKPVSKNIWKAMARSES
jgi:hypothetical protein